MPNPYTLQDIGGLHGGDVLKGFLSKSLDYDGDIIGGVAGATTLAADVAAGATTLIVSSAANINIGQLFGLGAGLSKNEMRRVTAVAGTTLTVNAAYKYAHTTGETIQTRDFWVSPLMWGAQPSSSVDSFRNLSNMLIDQQTAGTTGPTGATFGILGLGHTLPFYSSRPLWLPDFHWSQQFGLVAKAPFGIDCTLGVWTYDNWPHQHLLNASGQFGTISAVDTAADGITFNVTPGSLAGDEVAFYTREGLGTLPAPLEEGRTYYLKTNLATNKWTLSIDKWGASTIDITDIGSGEIVWWSTGSCRVNADRLYLSGGGKTAGISVDKKTGGIRGLGGFRGTLQQQSRLTDPRFENFAGWGCTIDGQQSEWFNTEIISNARGGFRVAGGKFIYCYGGNFEGNDINLELADTFESSGSAPAAAAFIQNNIWVGTHFENPGRGSFLVQTLTITGVPASGTFDLKAQRLDGSATDTVGTLNWNASAADAQTICDAYFGGGNMVVSGGPLPGAQLTFTFQGAYQYGWGMVLSVANSTVAGGSYTISLINPNGRQISFKNGLAMVFDGCVDSQNTNPVTNLPLDFITVEGLAATLVNYSSYELRSIWSTAVVGNFITDPLRRNLTRLDNDAAGASSFIAYWLGAGRHDNKVGRHYWLVGDGGRYAAFGTASTDGNGQTVPTWEIGGATSQQQQLLRLLMGSSQTGNPLEVADSANNLLYSIDTKGIANPPALRALIAAPAYSASITPNASAAEWQTITVTDANAFTINAPTSPPSASRSQTLTVEVLNSSGGAMGVITWNAAFVFAGLTWTNPASTKKRYATFRWNGTKWVAVTVAAADY